MFGHRWQRLTCRREAHPRIRPHRNGLVRGVSLLPAKRWRFCRIKSTVAMGLGSMINDQCEMASRLAQSEHVSMMGLSLAPSGFHTPLFPGLHLRMVGGGENPTALGEVVGRFHWIATISAVGSHYEWVFGHEMSRWRPGQG